MSNVRGIAADAAAAIVQRLTGVAPDGRLSEQRRRRLVEGIEPMFSEPEIWVADRLRHPDGAVRLSRHPSHGADRRSITAPSASRPNSTTPAASRKRPPSCSRNTRRVAPAPSARPQEIIASARAEAERIAAEAKTKMEDFVARRTKTAESKIALAEAQAVADVRAAAADAAVAAASTILSQSVKGAVADDLLAKGIAEVPREAELTRFINADQSKAGARRSRRLFCWPGCRPRPTSSSRGFGFGSGFSACGSKPI